MNQASKIMLTGGSAGAIAAFLWSNYLQSLMVNPDVIYTVPDSGIFLNTNTFKQNAPLLQLIIQNLAQLMFKSEQTPITQCNKEYPGEEWKCVFLEGNYKYLKGKYLYINSEYDQWAISNIMQIKCLKKGVSGYTLKNCSSAELNYIQDYRSRYMDFVNNKLRKSDVGIWSIACSTHVYAPYRDFYDVNQERVPRKIGMTVKQAIEQFVIYDKIKWSIDELPWPSNDPCAF